MQTRGLSHHVESISPIKEDHEPDGRGPRIDWGYLGGEGPGAGEGGGTHRSARFILAERSLDCGRHIMVAQT